MYRGNTKKHTKREIYSHKFNGIAVFSFVYTLFSPCFVACLPCFACIYKLNVVCDTMQCAYISGSILLSFTKLCWYWKLVCGCVCFYVYASARRC